MDEALRTRRPNFLTEVIDADLASGKNAGRVVTRFPPEPNGFLHVGHAKSIILNFGLAARYGGRSHLRFDDTNPTTEDADYVAAIQEDVRWLGYDWGSHLYYASDFFENMYGCAQRLIREGKAYVDSQPVEAIREQRGSFERPGRESPYRDRTVDENLALFSQMRSGDFADGACVLRAKIDMAHPNVLMRDPLLYRIRHAHHHRTQDRWCIYPMYDYAHPLEDAFEGVTHSICTLEFESNRELYDWVLDNLGPWDPRPRQYEFARLALGYTVLSKRKLLQLVTERRVSGWDDPRMPTLAGMRRRGVTPEALREFADLIGVAKNNSLVDIGKLEFALRADLEGRAPRALAVLDPLKVVITTWPEAQVEEFDIPWWPGDPGRGGTRKVPFGHEILIERGDFAIDPPRDWKRLAPGREVRLIGAYVVRCDEVVRGPDGEITELRCSHDPASRGGSPGDGRKVPGTLHWVHAGRAARVPVRLYDRLFGVESPEEGPDFLAHLNLDSLVVAEEARVEPALLGAQASDRFQFLRLGFFFADPVESKPGAPVFNRTITLRDTWTRTEAARPAAEVPKSEPPPKPSGRKSRAELRAERRDQDPKLKERFTRYVEKLGLTRDDADLLSADDTLAGYFEGALAVHPAGPSVSKWLVNDLLGSVGNRSLDELPMNAGAFGRFVALVDEGKVSTSGAKALLTRLVEQGGEPATRLDELGLVRATGEQDLVRTVEVALASMTTEVDRYRAGEKKLLGVLIGAVMRQGRGTLDAQAVRKALLEKLG